MKRKRNQRPPANKTADFLPEKILRELRERQRDKTADTPEE